MRALRLAAFLTVAAAGLVLAAATGTAATDTQDYPRACGMFDDCTVLVTNVDDRRN